MDEARVVTAAVMCEHGLNRCMVLPGSGLYGRLARSGLPLPEAAFSPCSHLIACGPTASGISLETPASEQLSDGLRRSLLPGTSKRQRSRHSDPPLPGKWVAMTAHPKGSNCGTSLCKRVSPPDGPSQGSGSTPGSSASQSAGRLPSLAASRNSVSRCRMGSATIDGGGGRTRCPRQDDSRGD